MLNPNLTKEEAIWLIEKFAPRMGGIVNGNSMSIYFLPARTLIMGKPAEAPSCGCHYLAYAKMTSSMYSQYKEEIHTIAYPPVTVSKRGRKKKES